MEWLIFAVCVLFVFTAVWRINERRIERLKTKALDDKRSALREKISSAEDNAGNVDIGIMKKSALDLMVAPLGAEMSDLVSNMDNDTVEATQRFVGAVEAISESLETSGEVVSLGRFVSSVNIESEAADNESLLLYSDFIERVALLADNPLAIVHSIVSDHVRHGTMEEPDTTVDKAGIASMVQDVMNAYADNERVFVKLSADDQIALAS